MPLRTQHPQAQRFPQPSRQTLKRVPAPGDGHQHETAQQVLIQAVQQTCMNQLVRGVGARWLQETLFDGASMPRLLGRNLAQHSDASHLQAKPRGCITPTAQRRVASTGQPRPATSQTPSLRRLREGTPPLLPAGGAVKQHRALSGALPASGTSTPGMPTATSLRHPAVQRRTSSPLRSMARTTSPLRSLAAPPAQPPCIVAAPRTPKAADSTSRSLTPVRCCSRYAVTVIAPGAGMGANADVYRQLERSREFKMTTVGQSRASYDRYPKGFPNGFPEPNLGSFAQDVLVSGVIEQSDCLVLGSRGGQVVLPQLWTAKGAAVPPAVVINGGCAAELPKPASWPLEAVTFLLLGGQDHFRGKRSPSEYIKATIARAPQGSRTTAVLYVQEMRHMPQPGLLAVALQPMLRSVLTWKAASVAPISEFRPLVAALAACGWSGCLFFTDDKGAWQDIVFGTN